jgi:hypothetical protein
MLLAEGNNPAPVLSMREAIIGLAGYAIGILSGIAWASLRELRKIGKKLDDALAEEKSKRQGAS